jgi:DNA-binding TFAR19-related protein (PDSD5 family)
LDEDERELEMIRRKKMAKLLQEEKKLQQEKEREEKAGAERKKILQKFLADDAKVYLDTLRESNASIAKRIEDIIMYLIIYRGIRQRFTQLEVRYIERQIKGEEPKIRVHRNGETSDFGAYVREAIKKDSD